MNVAAKIKPVAQQVTLGQGKAILAALGEARFTVKADNLTGTLAASALDLLYSVLSGAVDGCAKCAGGALQIVLELSNDVPAEVKKNALQAYRLTVTEDKITLTGYGEAGLYYAVTTLSQLITVENNLVYVPALSVLDWPDLKTRGHFMECRFGSNLMTLDDWKGLVDDMASMKLNQLVVALYGCWCVQYDGIISEYVYVPIPEYPLLKSNVIKRYYSPKNRAWVNEEVEVPMVKEDFFGDLIAYGKSRGVEVLPLWNSYGHNTLLPRMYPEVSAKHDGELSGHSLCTTNPQTTEMLCNIFDSIIDRYLKPNGIESFHIGMDEVWNETATDVNDLYRVISPWCECDECQKQTNEEKFINHAIKLIRHLKSRGMKNIYIYSDMMRHADALRNTIDQEKFKNLLVENDLMDVTVIDWWTYSNHKEHLMFDTMRPELGIRATVKPWNSYYHWNISFNAVPNVYLLSEMANKENAEGLQSYSAWDRVCDRNHVSMADYSWNFAGTGDIDTYNDRYAYRAFGAKWKEARRAFELMDLLTDDRHGSTEGDDAIGNRAVLQMMAYYSYSYVRAGKPYPRNYPGEPMTQILEKRALYEGRLQEIVDYASEALAIFNNLANDASVDTDLARRYSCEVENYLSLALDYRALLQIHDILAKPERNESVSAQILAIAKERKEARLSLMLRMELTKHTCNIPSHLRNQSIYLMVFTDIESYAANTAPEALSIDVQDLGAIGSKAFYKLR